MKDSEKHLTKPMASYSTSRMVDLPMDHPNGYPNEVDSIVHQLNETNIFEVNRSSALEDTHLFPSKTVPPHEKIKL